MGRNADEDLNEIATVATKTYLGDKLAVGYTEVRWYGGAMVRWCGYVV